jgi:Rha family phage regulatory protein
MKVFSLHPTYQLFERKGKPACSSLQVAERFNKRHDNVVRDIETKIFGVAPNDFTVLNFEETKIRDSTGRMNKCYLMARDGFTLLAMGFAGTKAMKFKVDYISRFNDMEAFIAEQYAAKMEFPQFTEAVMMAHDEPKSYHFSNECDMINRIVLGVPAKAIREANGLKSGESIRPYLSEIQIADIRALQMADVGLLASGMEFQERKDALYGYYDRKKILKLSA